MVSNRDVLQFREKQFLLIDDMENACAMMRSILVSMGFIRTETTHKLAIAETMIQKNHYDVILCDNNMGTGETGQMFMERLRREGTVSPRTVFIIISAETYTGAIFAAVEQQPDAYIAKPFVPATLTEKLIQQIRIKEALSPFYDAEEDQDSDRSIAVLKTLSQSPKTKAVAHKLLGKKLLETGRASEAYALYHETNEKRLMPWSAVGEAEALEQMGKSEQAIALLNQLIDDNPNAIQALESLRKVYEKEGNATGAYELLKKVCKLNPTNIDRQSDLGQRALNQHDVETAVGAFKQALRTANGTPSESPDHYMNLAQGIRKAVQCTHDERKQDSLIQEAAFHLSEAAKQFKSDPRITAQQSLVKSMEYSNKGKDHLAEQELRKAFTLIEESGLSERDTLDFIETAYFSKSASIGDQAAQKLMKKNPHNRELHEAVKKVQEGPVNYHDRVEAARLISEGSEAFANKQWDKSARQFEKALEKAPHSINLRLNVVHALIFQLKEDFSFPEFEKAKTIFSTIIELDEDHPSYKKQKAFQGALDSMERKLAKRSAA